MLDIKEIMKILPHRFPFLLVDRVLEITPDKIRAVKNVSMNEPFFQGHFPGHPVMPGVLIVEALAQCAGIHTISTSGEDAPENMLTLFMGVDGVKFRKQVVPGDQLEMVVTIIRKKGKIVKAKGEAFVDGQLACEGELTAMMTVPE
ncbi:beta-hydroxyacyl-(acyl-carrier-protein) dehydratase FabZ [Denitrovibrio acetiphilus DSM 12809]|uniref:3-hydroxyacyl-[acyl-carrier-protein] dehydratase FabZ n=1 Tax=Denitrovibrio acetiphilus (strain DSM 12809 / NBRC 114555 / N2460) TaxID=522772 RepID=D4H332_DENA2|nr:3-hydroxyacyl-ACP dehydratase FabZ [Denitrovibrio acetiphilus]ADD69055.1 beta-hydroxyacyl-(acyl-carrier-protein) dehydratase FabZ [Denitrovibrio acetiphilus DSM 12809]